MICDHDLNRLHINYDESQSMTICKIHTCVLGYGLRWHNGKFKRTLCFYTIRYITPQALNLFKVNLNIHMIYDYFAWPGEHEIWTIITPWMGK